MKKHVDIYLLIKSLHIEAKNNKVLSLLLNDGK